MNEKSHLPALQNASRNDLPARAGEGDSLAAWFHDQAAFFSPAVVSETTLPGCPPAGFDGVEDTVARGLGWRRACLYASGPGSRLSNVWTTFARCPVSFFWLILESGVRPHSFREQTWFSNQSLRYRVSNSFPWPRCGGVSG